MRRFCPEQLPYAYVYRGLTLCSSYEELSDELLEVAAALWREVSTTPNTVTTLDANVAEDAIIPDLNVSDVSIIDAIAPNSLDTSLEGEGEPSITTTLDAGVVEFIEE